MSDNQDDYIKQLEAQVNELEEQLHDFVSLNAEHFAYKIVNQNGLYSTGGAYPHFTKSGKTWATLGGVQRHLTVFKTYGGFNPHKREIYENAKVVKVTTFATEQFDIIMDDDKQKISIDVDQTSGKI